MFLSKITELVVGLRTLFSLTAFKNAPNPKFVQNLSRRLFFGVPIRGSQICQKFVENLSGNCCFQIFDKFLTNLGPPDWNPEKQSSGQILDKFGVRGVFECCKGKKGSQPLGNSHPVIHCRILFVEFRSECHGIGERQGVFGSGPE